MNLFQRVKYNFEESIKTKNRSNRAIGRSHRPSGGTDVSMSTQRA